MIRAAVICLLLSGCAGVPPAVVWATVGGGLGFGAAALKFDDDALHAYEAGKRTPLP